MDGGQGAAGRQGAHHAPMSGRSLGWGPALSAGLLAGCSSSFPSGFAFTPQSERAVLAFGLAPEAPSITMHVARIDPDTCRLMGGGGRYERTPFPFTPNKRSFVLDDLEPGFYAVTSVYDGAGLVRFSHTFEDKAQAFELRSGRINYVGDLRLTIGVAKPSAGPAAHHRGADARRSRRDRVQLCGARPAHRRLHPSTESISPATQS